MSDACTACGPVGSAAYVQCEAQIAIGIVPACAKQGYEQSQQALQNNLKSIPQQVGNTIQGAGDILSQLQGLATDFTWLQSNWGRLMIALIAIVIVGVGFWVLASGG